MTSGSMTLPEVVEAIRSSKASASSREAKHLHDNLLTLLTGGRSHKMSPVVKMVFEEKTRANSGYRMRIWRPGNFFRAEGDRNSRY